MNLEFLLQFLIGGLIVTGTTYLVENFNTKIAAIFWSLPYTLFPVMFTMWYKHTTNKDIAQLGLHSAYSLIILFIFLYSFYWMMIYLGEGKFDFWYSLGIAFFVWAIAAYIFYCCL